MSLDLDRITHPLRLAQGSHQPGSGKGCAMNVISYINGDAKITDYPECSARPLARMVQSLNDELAGVDGFLSPENSIIVLDLGWLTVGTADTPREIVWRWMADLLVHPEMGLVNRVRRVDVRDALIHMATLYMRESRGERVTVAEWRAARDQARKAKSYVDAAAAANAYAAAAAYTAAYTAAYADAYADADADAYAAADAAAYTAAYADAYTDAYADARITFTRWAIEHWRELAGLDTGPDIDVTAVDNALARIEG